MKQFFYKIMTDQNQNPVVLPVKGLLRLLSWIYTGIIAIREMCYRYHIFQTHDIGLPVISVGNIVMGGTGKTPLVIYIAHYIEEQLKKPVVLMRGFMDKGNAHIDGQSDEAILLEKRLANVSILVGAHRVQNAKNFLKEKTADIFILDDGFQHWPIERACNIVVIDCLNPFGNKCLIPRGILRESLSSLKRADIFVLSRSNLIPKKITDIQKELQKYNKHALIVEIAHEPKQLFDPLKKENIDCVSLKHKSIVCFSSIGNPLGFEKTLDAMGCAVKKSLRFIDHYTYTKYDIEQIVQEANKNNVGIIVTTMKDMVKLDRFLNEFSKAKLLVLDIDVTFQKGEEEFCERITRLL